MVGLGPFERITSVDVEAAVGVSPSKNTDVNVVSPAIATPAPVATAAPKAAASPTPPPIPGFLVAKRSHGIAEALEATRRQRSQERERQGLA